MIHKFFQTNFQNGFETHNSILDTVSYDPEVIFIGTFNHGWSWNKADFFYGRGMYMWTVLGNLFLYNENRLIRQRNFNYDNPDYNQIFEICRKGKIVFADLVKGIKENISVKEYSKKKYVLVNGEFSWPKIKENGKGVKEYSDKYLNKMGKLNWLEDNSDTIIEYINNTPTIKHVYFTFKSETWIVEKMDKVKKKLRKNVKACSIFTPTASGFRKNLSPPYNERAWSLAHCWVWNGLNHSVQINKKGYGHLDHGWLIDNNVNPNKF